MKNIKMAAVVAAVGITTVSAFAQNQGIELLQKMESRFQNLKSVSGTFSQSRIDPTFKTKTTVPARFWILKPNYYKAEFQSVAGQKPEVQLISKQMFYNYVPQLNQVTTYKFQGESNVRDLNYLLLGFGAKTDEITKVYKVTPLPAGDGVQLIPRSTKDASFQYIQMQVDPSSFYPRQFTMRQSDGTDLSVSLNLSSLQVNPPITASDFNPNFGRDVHTVNMQ